MMVTAFLAIGMLLGTQANAQSCCSKKETKSSCSSTKSSCGSATSTTKNNQTSGCSPSSCRGAKTKFGEAKVITNLRADLIALKADMEKSTNPKFSTRSYDIHGVVGETDEKSIEIIAREIQVIEQEIAEKKEQKFKTFTLPKNKAKQIQYLKLRIIALQELMS